METAKVLFRQSIDKAGLSCFLQEGNLCVNNIITYPFILTLQCTTGRGLMLVLKVYVSPCGKRHLWASRIQVQPVQPVMLAIRNKAL
jgi:hypothetical protein